jgi:anthranilate phosphoribosyltransferase
MELQAALARVVDGADLSRAEMNAVMRRIMSGDATDAQIGGLLVALRVKGETIDEIAGAAEVMREMATPVAVRGAHLVDLVGTGGDGANLFNVSTAACFVAAAAGAQVAKHGNRSVSSTSGSSDVLECLGVPLDLSPEQVAQAIESVGLGFMFAPAHHSAMRYAIGPRRELGLRTLFNLLGPLTNPAGVRRQVLGVFSPALCRPLAEALAALGSEHAMVVHAEDGLDELSIAAPTRVCELRDGTLSEYRVEPAQFGLAAASLDGLSVNSPQASAALIRAALGGEPEAAPARAIIALNAGACIYVAGLADSLADGVARARELIDSGAARDRLDGFVACTQALRAGEA